MKILRKYLEPKDHLSSTDVRKGLRMYIMDGFFSMGMNTLQGGVYLTAFALALGASQKMVGFIASIAFMSQLMQVPGLFILNKSPERKKNTVIITSIARLLWIPILFIPLFSSQRVTILIVFLFFSAIIANLPNPSWNSLLRDLIPARKMGKVNSSRILISTVLALVLTISGGYFVDWWSERFPEQNLFAYSILFGIGVLSGLTGVIAILRIPEPRRKIEVLPLWTLLKTPIADKNFRRLLLFLGFWNFAVNMSSPFFVVFMLKRLDLSLFLVTVMLVTSQLTAIIFLRVWGTLADRYSNKSVLAISAPLFILVVLSWIFTATPDPHDFTLPLLYIIHVLNGIALAGVTLGITNIALKLSPSEYAHGYMTIVGMTTSVTGTIAPLFGGIMADIFSHIEVGIPLIISRDADSFTLPLISLKGLDFLFLMTFVFGLLAVHFLSHVHERGEVPRKKVLDGITEAVITPLKSLSMVTGIGRIAIMPLSGWMVERRKKRNNLKHT